MLTVRTDLASEAAGIAEQAGKLSGVSSSEYEKNGLKVTVTEILNEAGAEAVGKPIGKYITVDYDRTRLSTPDYFPEAAKTLTEELKGIMPQTGSALVVGLGNRRVTPDALGPRAVDSVMVTRHLIKQLPKYFGSMRETSAVCPGVLGMTGIETSEIIKGVCARVSPAFVIAIDALAAGSLSRLCNTVQLSAAGIAPGSGVGNNRTALTQQELGVPVIAVGVPTVMGAETIAEELSGGDIPKSGKVDDSDDQSQLIVTPQDIDLRMTESARLVGYAISMALHGVTLSEVAEFIG